MWFSFDLTRHLKNMIGIFYMWIFHSSAFQNFFILIFLSSEIWNRPTANNPAILLLLLGTFPIYFEWDLTLTVCKSNGACTFSETKRNFIRILDARNLHLTIFYDKKLEGKTEIKIELIKFHRAGFWMRNKLSHGNSLADGRYFSFTSGQRVKRKFTTSRIEAKSKIRRKLV